MKRPTQHWQQLQELLRSSISAEEFEVWFSPLTPQASPAGHLHLAAPSNIYVDYIHENYAALLRELGGRLAPQGLAVHLVAPGQPAEPAASSLARSPLNPRYTFSSFVSGPSNQFARAAAASVAENPGTAYNPLFLYGGSGLGKTHLLHAIGNRIRSHRPDARILYVPNEQFVNELITSIRRQTMPQFREAYRSVEVLLLDDAHGLGGKERTQEEFFHTFNTLHEAGHQIVLTADTPPSQIQGLEERLRTRFVWGLVADIQPPDLETKCAIIREKAHHEGIDLPDDVVLFIARRVRENVRQLEGYLNRVLVYSSLTAQTPTVETARAALNPLLPEERHVTPGDVVRFVAHHYGVKVADLKGRDNRRSVAFPRQVAMYLMREILSLSYPEIGKFFAKHHSTVMYSVETITDQRLSNPSLDATLTTFVENFR